MLPVVRRKMEPPVLRSRNGLERCELNLSYARVVLRASFRMGCID